MEFDTASLEEICFFVIMSYKVNIFIITLQGNMSYKDLLAGLIYEGEIFQALNHFTFMTYKHLQFCDEHAKTVNQRSGGICLLTNKRILFLSSQLSLGG